jgi:hypothetical protein
VPFSTTFETHPIVERVQRMRQQPIAACGLAVVLVVLATLGRWAIGEYVGARIPFITFNTRKARTKTWNAKCTNKTG